MRLSVIIITRNESNNIQSCLDSVAFANEIVIVDAGSSDDTVKIASDFGAKVVSESDWPGFGKQKNRALDLATGDWVLSIDADERVSLKLREEIMEIVLANCDAIYSIPRRTNFCGQWIDHCGWSPDLVARLFKRGAARFSDDLVHERLVAANSKTETMKLEQHLLHYSYPDPQHVWMKMESYSRAWALQRFQKGQRTSIARAAVSALYAFCRSYFFRLGFLDGSMGLVVCAMQAQTTFSKYFQLYYLAEKDAAGKQESIA